MGKNLFGISLETHKDEVKKFEQIAMTEVARANPDTLCMMSSGLGISQSGKHRVGVLNEILG